MATQSPPGEQRPLVTWSKLFLSVFSLSFIILCVVGGVSIAPYITPFGLLLNARWLLQILFAYLNNKRYITVLGRTIVNGVYRLAPDLPQEEVDKLEAVVGKYITIEKFLEVIYSLSIASMPNFTAKLHLAIVANLAAEGYHVVRSVSVVIPGFGVTLEEMIDSLEAVLAQTMPALEIWAMINDPKNLSLIQGVRDWIKEKRRELTRKYKAGQITQELYVFQMRRLKMISLSVADKRTAMAAGWLSTHNIPEDQLEPMIKHMFDHPEEEVILPTPNTQISINLDSDTHPHSWALFITYLCFVLFGLSGLTSNVRIKNMPASPWSDPSKSLWKGLMAWLILWWTFFRYDEANNKERAAESYFHNVVCMSGPWMAIDTSIIGKFIGAFANFTYKGVRIRQGDDRYTTYWLNKFKLRVGYCPWVKTETDAPDTWTRLFHQQERWTVSMYVVFFTSVVTGQILSLHPWSMLDQFYAAGFAFVMAGVLGRLTFHALVIGLTAGLDAAMAVVLPYLLVFLVINFLRGAYSAWTNKMWKGFLNSFYVIVVFIMLFPLKVNLLMFKGLVQDPKKYPQLWLGREEAK